VHDFSDLAGPTQEEDRCQATSINSSQRAARPEVVDTAVVATAPRQVVEVMDRLQAELRLKDLPVATVHRQVCRPNQPSLPFLQFQQVAL
jgi:hypothetical protein